MKLATEDKEEFKVCMKAFEKRERIYYFDPLEKSRKKGEGLYSNANVNMRWMTWRECWDYLKS